MFKQDWAERQIEAIGDCMAVLLFGKKKLKNILENLEENDTVNDLEEKALKLMVDKYLLAGEINKAEDIILDSIHEKPSAGRLLIALNFYNEISKWEDDKLIKHNYSRDEIEDGVKHLKRAYGVLETSKEALEEEK